jgi:site-specific recombinase XerD
VYALALARLQEQLGADTPVGQITARRLAQFMGSSYQHLAPASWNRVVATLGSFFAYTTRQGWTGKSPAAGLERRRSQTSRDDHLRRRAIPKLELTAFLDAQHPLREKTLWWLLYETAARANEILALNVADLDMPRRRAVVIGKGGRAELVGWETKTARLLPRHLQGRTSGPLFLADIAPAPARQPALADLDPDSGRARVSYRRAEELFSAASGGWTLHQLRHSRLTHLAEHGIQLPILLAKSRHTSLSSLGIYAQPTFDAVAAATAAIDPDRRH